MWIRLNGRCVDPGSSFLRQPISLAMLRDINMLLRKDALMKVDKDWKNMSRASRRRRRSSEEGRGWSSAAHPILGNDTRQTDYCWSLIHPHVLVTVVQDPGCGRGRIQQTPFVLMNRPTMVHARWIMYLRSKPNETLPTTDLLASILPVTSRAPFDEHSPFNRYVKFTFLVIGPIKIVSASFAPIIFPHFEYPKTWRAL